MYAGNLMRISRHRDQGGFVLVSVLWILAILTVVSLGFARRAMLERQMAWYVLDREQAQQMARGAVERALIELRNMAVLNEYNHQAGYTGVGQRWAMPVDLFGETAYFAEAAKGGLGEDICVYAIEDCERRISLNHASREVFEELEALSFGTIEEILARRQAQKEGYQARRFPSVDDLRAIQDFSVEDWYGSRGEAGLRDLLTLWGDGLINVNTAPAAVLSSLPGVDPEVVDAIMDYRSGPDGLLYTADDRAFETMAVLGRELGVSAEKLTPIRSNCKTSSRFFIIRTQATRRRGKINAFCMVVVEMRGSKPAVLEWKEQAVGS